MQRIADEAGVKRSIIRHYIGNREHLLKAITDRVTERRLQDLAAAIENLSGQDLIQALLDLMFPEELGKPDANDIVTNTLVAECHRDPSIRHLLQDMIVVFEREVVAVLTRVYPEAGHSRCEQVVHAILSLSLGHGNLLRLGLEREVQPCALRSFAEMLLETLQAN